MTDNNDALWAELDASAAIREFALQHPDIGDERELAAKYLRKMKARERQELLMLWVSAEIWAAWRSRQHKIEVDASKQKSEPTGPAVTEGVDWRQRLFDNPEGQRGLLNAQYRKQFKRWCGPERFQNWLSRLYDLAGDGSNRWWADAEHITADFHEDGVQAYYRERLMDDLFEMVFSHAERIRLDVTEELLGSSFALGDGVRVTWGNATVAEHRQRVDLLLKMSAGTVETAARHQAAIALLEAEDVPTLARLRSALLPAAAPNTTSSQSQGGAA